MIGVEVTMFKNMNVGRKITVGFGAVLGLLAIVALAAARRNDHG